MQKHENKLKKCFDLTVLIKVCVKIRSQEISSAPLDVSSSS